MGTAPAAPTSPLGLGSSKDLGTAPGTPILQVKPDMAKAPPAATQLPGEPQTRRRGVLPRPPGRKPRNAWDRGTWGHGSAVQVTKQLLGWVRAPHFSHCSEQDADCIFKLVILLQLLRLPQK